MPGRCTFTATSRPSCVRARCTWAMLAAATDFEVEPGEVLLQRPAEIALQDLAHLRPRGGRHAVLEPAQCLRPGLREQIESRREQLAHLQERAAVTQAGLDEAPRVARVQRLELRARTAFGHERRLDRVQPIARGDLREQPADARRAAAARRPALDLGAERARVAGEREAIVAHRLTEVDEALGDPAQLPDGFLDARNQTVERRDPTARCPAARGGDHQSDSPHAAQSHSRGPFVSSERPTKASLPRPSSVAQRAHVAARFATTRFQA